MKPLKRIGNVISGFNMVAFVLCLFVCTQAGAQDRQKAERQIYNTGPTTQADQGLDTFTEAELEAYCECYADRVLEQVLAVAKKDVSRLASIEDQRARSLAAAEFGSDDRYSSSKRKPSRHDRRQCRRLAKTFR